MLGIDQQFTNLPWLADSKARLESLVASDQCPHALLIHGPHGTGRRQLAIWLVERLLGTSLDLAGADPETLQLHPDLLVVEPELDKEFIKIGQIRQLIEFTELTSHHGAARCAVICPAERMNKNSVNSLLKTLEEPAAGVVLILISETLSRLPATVVSRCQRLRVPIPPADVALSWLASQVTEPDIAEVLSLTGGAPLAALAFSTSGLIEQTRQFSSDLADLRGRRADPVGVGARWAKHPDLAFQWLYWQVAGEIRAKLAAGVPAATDFVKLDQIRELRLFIHGSVKAELSLTGILIDWYGAGETAGN
jgi:DNA polymerase-3 subunit delta'